MALVYISTDFAKKTTNIAKTKYGMFTASLGVRGGEAPRYDPACDFTIRFMPDRA